MPLKITAGKDALLIRLTMHQEFPYRVPIVKMIPDVVHPMVDAQTRVYQGPAIKTWTAQSSIINLLAQITNEFNKQPPIPRNQYQNQYAAQ